MHCIINSQQISTQSANSLASWKNGHCYKYIDSYQHTFSYLFVSYTIKGKLAFLNFLVYIPGRTFSCFCLIVKFCISINNKKILYFVKDTFLVCKTGRTFSTSSCPPPHSPSQTSISCNNGKYIPKKISQKNLDV